MSWGMQTDGEERHLTKLPKLLIIFLISILKEKCEFQGEHLPGLEPIRVVGKGFGGYAVPVVTEGWLAVGELKVVGKVTGRNSKGKPKGYNSRRQGKVPEVL